MFLRILSFSLTYASAEAFVETHSNVISIFFNTETETYIHQRIFASTKYYMYLIVIGMRINVSFAAECIS